MPPACSGFARTALCRHLQCQGGLAVFLSQSDLDAVCPAMPQGVGDCLLRDPIQMHGNTAVEDRIGVGTGEIAPDPRACGGRNGKLLQRDWPAAPPPARSATFPEKARGPCRACGPRRPQCRRPVFQRRFGRCEHFRQGRRLQSQPGQFLTDVVVEVLRDALPDLLGNRQQVLFESDVLAIVAMSWSISIAFVRSATRCSSVSFRLLRSPRPAFVD